MDIKEVIEHCREVACGCPAGDPDCAYQHDQLGDWLEELMAYRAALSLARAQEIAQAEKDGRLVVLPVNPYLKPTQENEMYICENGEVWAIYVTGCEAGPNSDGVFTVEYMTVDGDVFLADDIGKTVFLTRQEAEAALREEKK